jgi:hypothetical protein
VLEIMALAAAVVVSFGAATLGSLAILEILLRAAESANKKIRSRQQTGGEELDLSKCVVGSRPRRIRSRANSRVGINAEKG